MDAIPAFRHTLYYTRFTHFGAIFMYIYGDLREKPEMMERQRIQ